MAIPVKLPVFEGPLDLLLHLIEKNKIDIYDIPIAGITDQYLEYVRQMDHEDLDVTSEFLVMAATLLDIKSRMLLPREKDGETGEEEGDPREELVRRLLEYKMYKYLSEELAVYREQAGVRYFRAQKLPREVLNYRPPINYDELLGDTDLQSLQIIFGEVLRRKKSRRDPIRGGFGKIRREEISLDNKTLYIRAYLQAHPRTDFRALLESRESREEVIVTFLIILELMKTQKVHIVQDSIGGRILVEAGAPEDVGAGPEDAPVLPDTPEDNIGEFEDAPTDIPEDNIGEFEDAPTDTPEDDGELEVSVVSSSLVFDNFESTVSELQEDNGESADYLPAAFDSFESSNGELPSDSDQFSADSPISTEGTSPEADIMADSSPASCTESEVSPVGMPLTAFRRMELVTHVYPPEGLLSGSNQEDSPWAGDTSPASERRDSITDETKAVFSENFSSENSLSMDNIPVGVTQGSPVSESELSESIIPVDDMQGSPVSESELSENIVPGDDTQDIPVSESYQPVPALEEGTLSNDALVGQALTNSSEEAGSAQEQTDSSIETGSELEQINSSEATGSAQEQTDFSVETGSEPEQTGSSIETGSGLEQRYSSTETGFESVGEHFSAHLWCKNPSCKEQYFRTYSGRVSPGKVRPPRQWMRTRMTRLWARRFF